MCGRGARAVYDAGAVVAAFACLAAPTCAQRPGDAPETDPVTYFIAVGDPASGFRDGDRELARWALEAWAGQAQPPLQLEPAAEEIAAIRLYWVRADEGLYGETRLRRVGDGVGADVFVRPDLRGLGLDIEQAAEADPLYRETIVYLTCVHELGHALGLGHTGAFADIMYTFQFGGDIVAYFRRFRDQLARRSDIPTASPFSPADIEALRRLAR